MDSFPFSPGLLCNLVRKTPQNVEKIARFPGGKKAQNPVTYLAVVVVSVPRENIDVFVGAVTHYDVCPDWADLPRVREYPSAADLRRQWKRGFMFRMLERAEGPVRE